MKLVSFVSVLFVVHLPVTVGCGGGATTPADTSPTTPPPAAIPWSTIPVVEQLTLCDQENYARQEAAEAVDQTCSSEKNGTDCSSIYNKALSDSINALNLCLKELPAVPEACRSQFDPTSRTHDSDGDGIADFYEVWMKTNPCEPCSFGGNCQDCGGGGTDSSNCDGNQDWDGDGIPNAQDTQPLCPTPPPGNEMSPYCV